MRWEGDIRSLVGWSEGASDLEAYPVAVAAVRSVAPGAGATWLAPHAVAETGDQAAVKDLLDRRAGAISAPTAAGVR
jgi:hypothetical protein